MFRKTPNFPDRAGVLLNKTGIGSLSDILTEENSSGFWVLLIFSFLDASIFPFPVTTVFLSLIWMHPSKWSIYLVTVISGTLTGALMGYLLGHLLFLDSNGNISGLFEFLIKYVPGFNLRNIDKIQILFNKWDFWMLFAAAFTPIPYNLFSFTSGLFNTNFLIFCVATLFSQMTKFVTLSYVTIKAGRWLSQYINYKWKMLGILVAGCVVLLAIVILTVTF